MRKFTMQVTKKESVEGSDKAKAVPVGSIEVYYPLLEEMGIPIKPSKYVAEDKDGKEIPSTEDNPDAFPVYESDAVDMVFSALLASVKATARNRLQPGTATLKEGQRINSTVEEMLEEGTRNGEALANRREYFKSFKEWLPSLGKPAAWNAGLFDIISNVKGIPYQSQARKTLVQELVAQHAATLSPEAIGKWEKIMLQINEQAAAADPLA